MKKFLPILIACCILSNIFISFDFARDKVFAQSAKSVGKPSVDVFASVGEFYLSISGFISPYASIVLTSSDGVFLRAAVADSQGNFSISQVLIKKGFSGFCLTAVDYKRLGESVTCLSFPPAEGSIEMHGLFLPPTLGLSRTEVGAGESVMAFGYTMPGAVVTLKLSNGTTYTVTADNTGYYEVQIKDLPAGEYKISATAHYHGEESLSPTKQLGLTSLSLWGQFLKFLRELWGKLIQLLTSIVLNPLLLGIPIIILIIILILKLWPERPLRLAKRLLPQRSLHHYWFIGY